MSARRRYVATGAQLLEAVIDALELVQRDLDSELSGAAELWHRREDGLRPVSEPEGSSWLQRRLTDKLSGERGIIFHREVQVTHPRARRLASAPTCTSTPSSHTATRPPRR